MLGLAGFYSKRHSPFFQIHLVGNSNPHRDISLICECHIYTFRSWKDGVLFPDRISHLNVNLNCRLLFWILSSLWLSVVLLAGKT